MNLPTIERTRVTTVVGYYVRTGAMRVNFRPVIEIAGETHFVRCRFWSRRWRSFRPSG